MKVFCNFTYFILCVKVFTCGSTGLNIITCPAIPVAIGYQSRKWTLVCVLIYLHYFALSFYTNILFYTVAFCCLPLCWPVGITDFCLNPFLLLPWLLCLSHICCSPAPHLSDFPIFYYWVELTLTLAYGCFGLSADGWCSPLYISDPDPSFFWLESFSFWDHVCD